MQLRLLSLVSIAKIDSVMYLSLMLLQAKREAEQTIHFHLSLVVSAHCVHL